MPSQTSPVALTEADAFRAVVDILDENGIMAISTLREDGWPQTTLVSYFRDGLSLYFLVARESQKLANIRRDPRVSIALGRFLDDGVARGLSLSARVSEVVDPHRIEDLNRLMWASSNGEAFRPRPEAAATALLQASPEIISLIDHASFPGRTHLLAAHPAWRLEVAGEAPDPAWREPDRLMQAQAGARPH